MSSWLKCFPLICNYVKIGDLVDIHSWQQCHPLSISLVDRAWKNRQVVLVLVKIEIRSKAEPLWCPRSKLVLSCSSQTKMLFWPSLVWPFQFLEYWGLVQVTYKHDVSTLQCHSCDSSNNACIAIKAAKIPLKWYFYLWF